jgi:hypothetical protein
VSGTVGFLSTAGERLEIGCSLPWVADLIGEGAAGELARLDTAGASLHVQVEADRGPFDTRGWPLLTRGAWRRGPEVVVENACTSGFDLRLICTPTHASFTYRWRPPARDRAAAHVLRSRFHLLARSVLIQYPALWWAGTRGRAPLHASACTSGDSTSLLTGASGVGRSTLVLHEVSSGGRATGDNLSVADGTTVWGLVEPLRVEGGSGRRMPHGRSEARLQGRADSLVPDSIVVLRRGASDDPSLVACSAGDAARALVASTYMAGELRRYWAFAATLSAGTGIAPPHPLIAEVASALAAALPCRSLVFARSSGMRLSELLALEEEVGACA